MSPLHRRLVAAASVLALAASPALVGAAWADEGPPRSGTTSTAPALPAQLEDAIAEARADFRATALAARLALRTALRGSPTSLESTTARAAARASLQTARTSYVAAVSAAATRLAPGLALPRAVLEPAWWTGMSDGEWLTS